MTWAGWVVTALPTAMLLMSSAMKFLQPPQVIEGLAKYGYEAKVVVPLGIVELACTVLYVVPQTAVLGAILLTGYLGGATATHVRVGDAWFTPVLLGVLVWLGVYLRDSRLRTLVPLRR
jgi:hypothetical protein